MRLPALLALLTSLTPLVATALTRVDPVSVQRSGDDLVLTWPAVPGALGYRVYRSAEVTCATVDLVYEGPATTHTDAGVLAIPELAIYGVAAYEGAIEGPISAPVYKYPVELRRDGPGESGGVLVAFPERPGPADTLQLCYEINIGRPPTESWFGHFLRFRADIGRTEWRPCEGPFPGLPLGNGEAHILKTLSNDPGEVMVHGAAALLPGRDLPLPYSYNPGTGECLGLYWLSLPYDHAYPDLAQLAAAIPGAVRVEVQDPAGRLDHCQSTRGLRRASSSDPWSGDNFSLLDRRNQGVVVAVDRPSRFVPRRLCTRFGRTLIPAPVVTGPGRPTLPTGGGPTQP